MGMSNIDLGSSHGNWSEVSPLNPEDREVCSESRFTWNMKAGFRKSYICLSYC